MAKRERTGHAVRIHIDDFLFLQEEALQLRRERFRETRELDSPSVADVFSQLVEELQEHRRRADDGPGAD